MEPAEDRRDDRLRRHVGGHRGHAAMEPAEDRRDDRPRATVTPLAPPQGPGKVVHAVCSSFSVRFGSRAWWRLAAAMLAWPSRRSRLMARLRNDAITWGAFPVLTSDLSSRQVTSLTQ